MAADRAASKVRSFRPGAQARDWSRLLDAIHGAKECLLDQASKARYDAQLRGDSSPPSATSQPAPKMIGRPRRRPAEDSDLYPPGMAGRATRPLGSPRDQQPILQRGVQSRSIRRRHQDQHRLHPDSSRQPTHPRRMHRRRMLRRPMGCSQCSRCLAVGRRGRRLHTSRPVIPRPAIPRRSTVMPLRRPCPSPACRWLFPPAGTHLMEYPRRQRQSGTVHSGLSNRVSDGCAACRGASHGQRADGILRLWPRGNRPDGAGGNSASGACHVGPAGRNGGALGSRIAAGWDPGRRGDE